MDAMDEEERRGIIPKAVSSVSLGDCTTPPLLRNPMEQHKEQYVINLWKYYNHQFLERQTVEMFNNLAFYSLFVCGLIYGLAFLPPPAVMLRHQEAVSDLLLGEEFPAETTHIFKNFYDVMTAQEMWEWAVGPLAGALLVEGEADGNIAALLGTNWLLGPVRIRQDRSSRASQSTCRHKLERAFGNSTSSQLVRRGVECTQSWENDDNSDTDATPFLDLAKPLLSLNGRSFIGAFPEWYSTHALANHSNATAEGAICCSQLACFSNEQEQVDAIRNKLNEDMTRDPFEAACSVNLKSKTLMPNPAGSYRSIIKADPTESTNLWAKTTSFGSGGYHIDLSGDRTTFAQQLLALQELGFTDQDTRTVTFQLVLLNANAFTNADEPIVLVCVDLNFVFSPSGHVQAYDRITSMQLRPVSLISQDNQDSITLKILLLNCVPVLMLIQELKVLERAGLSKWIRSGWSWFEIMYFISVFSFTRAFLRYMVEERLFLAHYDHDAYTDQEVEFLNRLSASNHSDAPIGSPDVFNDIMPLRKAYRDISKHLAHVCLIAAFKLFKYVSVFKSTTLLWDTLRHASSQLMTYSAVMVWVIIAFSLCSTLLWGSYSSHFHNLPASFFQLLRLAAGEATLEYEELKRAHAHLTPLLFTFFIAFVSILGMNLMIAIITDFYEEARDSRSKDEQFAEWAETTFCGKGDYEDFYRGKGLWNCPATPVVLRRSHEAYQALCGSWKVKPVPNGGGPRKWNAHKKEVEPLGTHVYPFVLRRSTKVYLRYGVEAHEYDKPGLAGSSRPRQVSDPAGVGAAGACPADPDSDAHADQTTGMLESMASFYKSVMSGSAIQNTTRDSLASVVDRASRTQSKSPPFAEGFLRTQNIDDKSEPARDHLDIWMAPSTLAQYRGIRYLEQLQKGDILHLTTPGEGGHAGQVQLRFVGFQVSRRATRSDKQAIGAEIQRAREEYFNARERAYNQAENVDTIREDKDLAEAENRYQKLHKQRGELEGVECTMIFEIAQADAWQKFRPAKAHERNLGERLKQACVREHFQDFPLSGSHEELHRWREQRRLDLESWLRRSEDHTITTQTVRYVSIAPISGYTAHWVDLNATVRVELIRFALLLRFCATQVAKVVAETVIGSLNGILPTDSNAAAVESFQCEIETVIMEQIIKRLAVEEKTQQENPPSAIKSCNSERSGAKQQHTTVKESDHANVMSELHEKGMCNLGMLVPDYDIAYPMVSSAMNRLMKLAQRAGKGSESSAAAVWKHTPLLDVLESAEFELKIPMKLGLSIVRRAIFQACSECCADPRAAVVGIGAWMSSWLPFGLVSQQLFFHCSVEQDIDDFLDAKCLSACHSMSRSSSGETCSKRKKMLQFMDAENSVGLEDFAYQLEHFVFKVKPKSCMARVRAWAHSFLGGTPLKHCFDGLRLPLRSQYSHVEQEIALAYLIGHYRDFIDRRRGSIPMPGDSYDSRGVLLDSETRLELERAETTEEDHAEALRNLEAANRDHAEALRHLQITKDELEAARKEIEQTRGGLQRVAQPAEGIPEA